MTKTPQHHKATMPISKKNKSPVIKDLQDFLQL